MHKVNPRESGIFKSFIQAYHTWIDCANFYQGKNLSRRITIDPDGIPVYYFMDHDAIKREKSSVIIIDAISEAAHEIESCFRFYSPGKKYLYFVNGWWDKSKYDLGHDYDIINHYFWLTDFIQGYISYDRFDFYIPKTYNFDNKKPYRFCCNIGQVRPERQLLVDSILTKLPQRDYILNMSDQYYGQNSEHLDLNGLQDRDSFRTFVGLEKYYHTIARSIPWRMYNCCDFMIVAESDIDMPHSFHFSEKVIKSLIYGIPLIILASPFYLKHLNDMGFRTYAELWDESYDEEMQTERRIDMITTVLQNLVKFDWQKNAKVLRQISQHNRSRMFELSPIIEKTFQNFEQVLDRCTVNT